MLALGFDPKRMKPSDIQLDKLQYKTIRTCIGAMSSTPTNSLLVEVHIRREFLTQKFIIKKIINSDTQISELKNFLSISQPITHNLQNLLIINQYDKLENIVTK